MQLSDGVFDGLMAKAAIAYAKLRTHLNSLVADCKQRLVSATTAAELSLVTAVEAALTHSEDYGGVVAPERERLRAHWEALRQAILVKLSAGATEQTVRASNCRLLYVNLSRAWFVGR